MLIPRPKRLKIDTQSTTQIPDHDEQSGTIYTIQATIKPGGYRLRVRENGVEIASSDEPGTHAANSTLYQLRTQFGSAIPRLEIEDYPALTTRGAMLDISRTRIPQQEELLRIVHQFAHLKLNHLQLYSEHAFAYSGCEEVWEGTDPMTPDQVRQLDRLCADHGLELAANQNCFGHLTRWLRTDQFRHLAETHTDWNFLGMPRSGPFSLCPQGDEGIGFIENLLDELLPCFSSPLVNIGCDETHDVGQGRSKAAVAKHGKGEVYGQFVSRLCSRVVDRGRRPMMWGDIAAEYPEVVSMLPEETIGLVWGYEPSSDIASMGRVWKDSGKAWWACPGTSSWRSYTGRSTERQQNIRRAATQAVSGDARGMLITDWGDVGHHQVWPIALLGFAEGADAAWTGKGRAPEFLEAVSLHVFGDRSLQTARWIEELGDADESLRAIGGVRTDPEIPTRLANASALFTELHSPHAKFRLPACTEPWIQTREKIDALLNTIPTGAGPLIEDELRHAARCSMFACEVAIFRRGGAGGVIELQGRLKQLTENHRRLWLIRSRLGGLDESTAFWESIQIEGSHGS